RNPVFWKNRVSKFSLRDLGMLYIYINYPAVETAARQTKSRDLDLGNVAIRANAFICVVVVSTPGYRAFNNSEIQLHLLSNY
ncbi:MAG: hypothetical protein AAFY76_24945, partial [Cyanobacteria bacterium J06649_11]